MRRRLAAIAGVAAAFAFGALAGSSHAAVTADASAAARSVDPHWQPAQLIDPRAGGLSSISCVSATWCRATDLTRPIVWRYDGSRWQPGRTFNARFFSGMGSMTCTSTTFCVATMGGPPHRSRIIMFNGRHWRTYWSYIPGTGPDFSNGGVDCLGVTFCLQTENKMFRVWDGASWSPEAQMPADGRALTCWAVRACRVADADGHVSRWENGVWARLVRVGGSTELLTGIRCVARTHCVVISAAGNAYTLDGSAGWSAPRQVTTGALRSLECVHTDFCVALSRAGQSSTFDGHEWTPPVTVAPNAVLVDVTCPATTFCSAVSYQGAVLQRVPGGWRTQRAIASLHGNPTAVSCSEARLCLLADEHGSVARFDGASWSAPSRLLTDLHALVEISCASEAFCMALTDDGRAVQRRDGLWGQPSSAVPVDADTRLLGLSCASATLCVANASNGTHPFAEVWNGHAWRRHDLPGIAYQYGDVSCVGTFCLLSFGQSTASYSNGVWNDELPPFRTDYRYLRSLSCVSRSYCLGVVGPNPHELNRAVLFDGTQWHDTPQDGDVPDAAVACASATSCVSVGLASAAAWDGANWTTPQDIGGGDVLVDVSCRGALCVTVGLFGNAVTT